MPYWQLFYHIVWATRNREAIISTDMEPVIYELIRTKAIGLGATVFALNGISDHVHLVTTIPPTIAVSTFAGQVKAVTTAKFNKSGHPLAPIYWQEGFGAFSFDRKRLPYFIQYVEKQKIHHEAHAEIGVLERIEGDVVKFIHENPSDYLSDFPGWMEDLKKTD
jgi:putative transposase